VTAVLREDDPNAVWECSHIGGDRVAATMLLPHGINYGWADTLGAQHMVSEYRAAAARSGSSSKRLRCGPQDIR
jgi:hypothetical protein